jgi:hypothetical protein
VNKYLAKILLLPLVLVTLPSFLFACSLYKEPKAKFDRELYIFIGEVIGYTDEHKSKRFFKNASGLKVKVLENVYLPQESNNFFEVFPLDITSDCRKPIGFSNADLQEDYPINSKIRVIASAPWHLPNKNKSGQLILEVNYPRYIYRNDLENQFSTTTNSIFNYADLKDYYYDYFEFELLKDLKRLEESSSDEEKIKIFERLICLPKDWIDFEASVQHYIVNPEMRLTLINKRKSLK